MTVVALRLRLEDRVGLTERECRAWIAALSADRRTALRVAVEMERALDAALDAGIVIPGRILTVERAPLTPPPGSEWGDGFWAIRDEDVDA